MPFYHVRALWHNFSLTINVKKSPEEMLPAQRKGKAIDVKKSLAFKNLKDAIAFYEKAQDNLQRVNDWGTLAGDLSADFQLTDANGNAVDRPLEKGDYFKIDVPGPGTKTGQGFDWVKIEAITIQSTPSRNVYSFRVRPSENPFNRRAGIAHFYGKDSTSTFSVRRNKNIVSVAIQDRNTQPNADVKIAIERIRDRVVGRLGVLAFSKFQWTKLVDGIMNNSDKRSDHQSFKIFGLKI
jgi:hypothetical protein